MRFSYEDVVWSLVNKCAQEGVILAKENAMKGKIEPLYLFFKAGTSHRNGELRLVADSGPVPEGFEMATGEGLRGGVPYTSYPAWVKERSTRLPILCSSGEIFIDLPDDKGHAKAVWDSHQQRYEVICGSTYVGHAGTVEDAKNVLYTWYAALVAA
jgi:hypothetical protein